MKSGDSGREETKHGGEGWPESAGARAAGLGLLGSAANSVRREEGNRVGETRLGIRLGSGALKRRRARRRDAWQPRRRGLWGTGKQGRQSDQFRGF